MEGQRFPLICEKSCHDGLALQEVSERLLGITFYPSFDGGDLGGFRWINASRLRLIVNVCPCTLIKTDWKG